MRGRAPAVILSAVLVAVFLGLMIAVRNRAETAAAGVASLLPFGWAFAAGLVSSVNPCGFFMLPAYLSYQLGSEEAGFYASAAAQRTWKALRVGLVATLGFVAVMGAAGVVISVSGQWLVRVFPYAGIVIGAALAGFGAWLLITGRTLGIGAASRLQVGPQRNLRNTFVFGVAYAVGSLSCTLPIFLLVVGGALAFDGLAGSLGQFISYALGMGSVLVAVTIGAALFRNAVARSLRAVMPYVHTVSALFLIGAGLYLVYYWTWLSGFILT
jgi:cytochrome c biogenesis protein CcdA